jgi:outer membrane protein assembly factor BamB
MGVCGPAAAFRPGHISVKTLDKGALATKGEGWTVKLPSGAPVRSPAVYDGMVFASGGFHSREFYAFEAQSGKLAWGIGLDDDGPSSPACEDGVCVFNTESCTTFAVAAKTGKLLWAWWLGDPLMSAPTIAHGRVFTAYPARGGGQKAPPPGATHALAAFDLATGKVLWQKWIDGDILSAPVAVGEDVYVTTFTGTVIKLAQASGEIRSATRTRATSAPVVAGGDVYFTQRAEKDGQAAEESVVAQDEKTAVKREISRKAAPYLSHEVQARSSLGEQGKSLDASNGFSGGAPASANAQAAANNVGQASVATLQGFQGSRVLAYKDVNVSTMGDEVVCNDRKSGKQLWSHKLQGDLRQSGGAVAAPPAAAGDNILVGTLDGEVRLLDPKSGKLVKSFKIGSAIRSQPVVDKGWIYVGTEDGRVVGIKTGDDRLSGWPQWGKDAARSGSWL